MALDDEARADGLPVLHAAVMFRVALLELLRTSRPVRLVVDVGATAHVATRETQLQGESLARVVRVVGRVDLDASASRQAAAWPTCT